MAATKVDVALNILKKQLNQPLAAALRYAPAVVYAPNPAIIMPRSRV